MRVIDGRHGRFICPDNDQYVGRSIALYGDYSEAEFALMSHFLEPGGVVVEAGANIGAQTVPLAKKVGPEGRVYAFEPQRLVHHILCGNLALNELENVHAFAMALGDRPGQVRIPFIHYGEDANYGGAQLGEEGEAVAMGTVDALRLGRLDLLKADVEGAEMLVLKGAAATIKATRACLYLENDRRAQSPALLRYLDSLGYAVWWHVPPLFSAGNYAGNTENVFSDIASVNVFAQHKSRERPVPDLPALYRVTNPEEFPLAT